MNEARNGVRKVACAFILTALLGSCASMERRAVQYATEAAQASPSMAVGGATVLPLFGGNRQSADQQLFGGPGRQDPQ
jgi:hypothetical protein